MNNGMFFDHKTLGVCSESFFEDFILHLKQKITKVPDWDFLLETHGLTDFVYPDLYSPKDGDDLLIISLQLLTDVGGKLHKLIHNDKFKLTGVYGTLLMDLLFNKQQNLEFTEESHLFFISLLPSEISYKNTIKPIFEINSLSPETYRPQILKMSYGLPSEYNDFLVIIESHG